MQSPRLAPGGAAGMSDTILLLRVYCCRCLWREEAAPEMQSLEPGPYCFSTHLLPGIKNLGRKPLPQAANAGAAASFGHLLLQPSE